MSRTCFACRGYPDTSRGVCMPCNNTGRIVDLDTDVTPLVERIAVLEAERTKTRERLASLEQGFVAHCALDHAGDQWCAPEEQRDAWRKTFNDSIDKIRSVEPTEINRVEATAPTKEPLDTRKLVYDFLTLPFYKQLTILRGLGLLTDEEVHSLVSSESNLIAFRRAKERNLLENLCAEIDRERKTCVPLPEKTDEIRDAICADLDKIDLGRKDNET